MLFLILPSSIFQNYSGCGIDQFSLYYSDSGNCCEICFFKCLCLRLCYLLMLHSVTGLDNRSRLIKFMVYYHMSAAVLVEMEILEGNFLLSSLLRAYLVFPLFRLGYSAELFHLQNRTNEAERAASFFLY